MVPKRDQRRGYASKHGIPLCCSVAMKPGKKPVTGQVMGQTRGQELRQITDIQLSCGDQKQTKKQALTQCGY